MEKNFLRKEITQHRNSMDKVSKMELDNNIFKNFIESSLYKDNTIFFVYINFRSEVDTKNIINKLLNDNKIVCVPKVDESSNYMDAIRITRFKDLCENKYGILEPLNIEDTICSNDIEVLITPGIAFDLKGNRVGFGKGYYDRFFKNISKESLKVALSYEIQLVSEIDVDEFDEKVDYIITENRIINTKNVDINYN